MPPSSAPDGRKRIGESGSALARTGRQSRRRGEISVQSEAGEFAYTHRIGTQDAEQVDGQLSNRFLLVEEAKGHGEEATQVRWQVR